MLPREVETTNSVFSALFRSLYLSKNVIGDLLKFVLRSSQKFLKETDQTLTLEFLCVKTRSSSFLSVKYKKNAFCNQLLFFALGVKTSLCFIHFSDVASARKTLCRSPEAFKCFTVFLDFLKSFVFEIFLCRFVKSCSEKFTIKKLLLWLLT